MGGVGGLSTGARPPEVAVVIVSWNTRDLLARAVSSAVAAAGETELKIFVVDNASTDGSAEMVRRAFPTTRLLVNDFNVGFGAANNQALAESSAPFALLLNSDAELKTGSMSALLAEMSAHPECGAVCPRLTYADGRFQPSFADFPSLAQDAVLLLGLGKLLRPGYPGYPEAAAHTAREVDWASGACLLVRRAAWGTAPPFDEGFPFYVEETDLCRRLRNDRWTVRFCPAAVAVHDVGQSAQLRADEQPGLLWQGRLHYYAKHKPAWQVAVLRAMVRVGYVARWTAWRTLAALRRGDGWRTRATAARTVLATV